MRTTTEITQEQLKELLHYDPETGLFTWLKVPKLSRAKVGCLTAQSLNSNGYLRVSIDCVREYAHRLAWIYVHGANPIGVIDHINGDKTDNRISNLRDVATRQNCENIKKPSKANTSGYLGVTWAAHAKLWMAQIMVNRKHHFLGYFQDPKEAHQAYLKAKRELHEGCTI